MEKGTKPTAADFDCLPKILANPEVVLLDIEGKGKIVVRLDYEETQRDKAGNKPRKTTNSIVAGGALRRFPRAGIQDSRRRGRMKPPGRDATLDSVRWPTDRQTIYRERRIGFPLLPSLPGGVGHYRRDAMPGSSAPSSSKRTERGGRPFACRRIRRWIASNLRGWPATRAGAAATSAPNGFDARARREGNEPGGRGNQAESAATACARSG